MSGGRMHHDPRPLVLHVLHHLMMGGMENGLVNLINRMPDTRYRHAIACIEDYSDFRLRLKRRDVPVHALHRSRVGTWRLRYEIFRLCRALRPSIVHSRGLSGLDALLPARLAGVARCVHGEHGWNTDDLGGVSAKAVLLRRAHAPLVDRYVAVSEQIRQYLVERVRIAPTRVARIHNGVDTERFAPAIHRTSRVLPAGFSPHDGVVIGTVARLQAVKDQATLVRAFAALLRYGEPFASRARLVIVGDGPLRAELAALVDSLGVGPAVWMPGATDDVAPVLRAMDVFVLPSLFEGISNTMLEAMASGVPVVATPVGGNAELVEDGITGRFFPVGDSERLAQILGDCVATPSLLRDWGRKARERAVTRFDLGRMVAQYQALYDELSLSGAAPSLVPGAGGDGQRSGADSH